MQTLLINELFKLSKSDFEQNYPEYYRAAKKEFDTWAAEFLKVFQSYVESEFWNTYLFETWLERTPAELHGTEVRNAYVKGYNTAINEIKMIEDVRKEQLKHCFKNAAKKIINKQQKWK